MPTVGIKVCGLTCVADALACASAGVDWVGLNFYPPSPRFIDEQSSAAIVAALPATTEAVGLFVNRPPAEVAATCARLGLTLVQLHGDEPPEDLAALAAASLRVVRAFRLADRGSIDAMAAHLERALALGHPPFAVLVDAYVSGQPGGTGHAIAEELLAALPRIPRLVLSGGLTPENVGERVARVQPWMVDVASGVESAPGRKATDRVTAFVRAARGS